MYLAIDSLISSERIEVCFLEYLPYCGLVFVGQSLDGVLELVVFPLHPSQGFREDERKSLLVGLQSGNLRVDARHLELEVVDPLVLLRVQRFEAIDVVLLQPNRLLEVLPLLREVASLLVRRLIDLFEQVHVLGLEPVEVGVDQLDVLLLVGLDLAVVFPHFGYLRCVLLLDLVDLGVLFSALVLDLPHHALLERLIRHASVVEVLHQGKPVLEAGEGGDQLVGETGRGIGGLGGLGGLLDHLRDLHLFGGEL